MNFEEYYEKYEKENPHDWKWEYDFNLGHLVSEARLHAGLTQKELADKMGTQQPSIARVEGGSVLPGHAFLKRLASAVNAKMIAPQFDFMQRVNRGRSASESETVERIVFLRNFAVWPANTELSEQENTNTSNQLINAASHDKEK